ncbi:MAG: T9SS type A sorting domain-containing protein, partial [Flavobacteriales bacterium]|nr:T9SS type A sorting domain-containing protein [Flavobacteriales bacterium]
AALVDNGSSDACGVASLALSKTAFDCSNVGANTVTLTVTDVNNNVSTTTATVTVVDNVAPVAVAQNVTVSLDATGNGSTTAAAVDNGSSDACGVASLSLSKTAFDCSNVGANTVTLTVTDNNGNVSTTTATVTVVDNVAPVAVAQNVTVYLDATGNGSTTAAAVDNGSSDACGVASLALSQTAFNCSHVGANAVVLTVTDNNGNVSTANATVIVVDNVAPVAVAQNINVALTAVGTVNITAAQVDNGSNDACGIASLSVAPSYFTCANRGVNTVTLTVTDNNGNVSTANAVVTITGNAVFNVSTSVTNVSCYQGADGAIDLSVSGGTAPYTYAWSNSATSEDISGLTAGSYSVAILDANLCDAATSATVTEPTLLVASIASLSTSSVNTTTWGSGAHIVLGWGNGPTSVTLNGSASGGTPGYSYAWYPSTGLSNANVANPVFTPSTNNNGCHEYSFQLTVTDANGCTSVKSVTIKVVNADCTPGNQKKSHKVELTKYNNKNKPVVICVDYHAVQTHLNNGATIGNASSCGSTTYSFAENNIEDVENLDLALNLFPNPSKGVVNFEMVSFDQENEVTFQIIDQFGKLILTQSLQVESELQEFSIDLNANGKIANGFYYARIQNGDNSFVKKFQVVE